MKRELGSFERALVISDRHAPFHIVNVLRLENAPPPQILRQSLKVLQNHHPFLSARLVSENGRYYFASLANPGLPFHVLPRWNDGHWMQVAEVELGTRMDVATGPLFRCTYLYDAAKGHSDIILSLFHAITDASSAAQLMHELLNACASFMDEKTVTVYELPPSPPVESRFPSAFRGVRLAFQAFRFALRQTSDEIAYRRKTRGKRIPPVHKNPVHGRILSMGLTEEMTESLASRARREKVTLNSALNAAMLLALNRRLYAGQQVPMRTFSFADLRPYINPPLEVENLACYISMLRYTVAVEGGLEFWDLARDLHEKIYSSLKSGDKFVASKMAEPLMKRVTRLKTFRMAATALNYNGLIPIQPGYGRIKVSGLHGFVSVFDLGPEFSAEAHIFNDRLHWDFMYLDADMSRDEARAIVEEIKSILQSAIREGTGLGTTQPRSPTPARGAKESPGKTLPVKIDQTEPPEKTRPINTDQADSSR